MKLKFYIPLLLGLLFSVTNVKAQDVAIKTNLLYDATATVNIGVEVGIAPKWTLDISGNLNAWNIDEDTKWRHWLAQPEARYWRSFLATLSWFSRSRWSIQYWRR